MSTITRPDFSREAAATVAAGAAAYRRAIGLGYCRIVCDAFRRTAKRERINGEAAETTALRVVPRMPDSLAGWQGRGPGLSA